MSYKEAIEGLLPNHTKQRHLHWSLLSSVALNTPFLSLIGREKRPSSFHVQFVSAFFQAVVIKRSSNTDHAWIVEGLHLAPLTCKLCTYYLLIFIHSFSKYFLAIHKHWTPWTPVLLTSSSVNLTTKLSGRFYHNDLLMRNAMNMNFKRALNTFQPHKVRN